ncbi:MAG: TIM-barrel domain-containing protein [Halobacteriaceae archaeon]
MPRGTVESVVEYTVESRAVELSCRVDFDDGPADPDDTVTLPARTDPVRIEFLAPDTFRFSLDGVPEAGGTTGTLDLDRAAAREPVDLTVTEQSGSLRLMTAELDVTIGLDEWSFQVRDADGQRLLAEQRDDRTAKAERRAQPLGYAAEQTNRWPYRITDAGTSFVLDPEERIYGFGETFTSFEKRGRTVDCWITQPNGTETRHSYKSVPLYLSTAGYGLLVDTTQRVTADVGDSSAVSTTLRVADDSFAFVFMAGPSFAEILETYTALTGRPSSVPRWSYGLWFSRMAYESRAEVERVLDRADERDIPVDCVHLDPSWLEGLCDLRWDETAFPEPESFVDELHDRGVRLSLWEFPYLLSQTAAFEEARDAGHLVNDGTGAPYLLDRLSWSGDRGGIVDFTDEAATRWWADRHHRLLEMGVDVFKCDFGEYLPQDAVLADGTTGRASRNRYPNLYTQTVHEAMAEAGQDPLLWARSGWAGGQQYPVHWGGDPATSFEALAASIRGGLSLALSGYGFWAADVGGFKGEPSTELYIRWAQFALLGNSHVRFHGTTPREPWHYEAPATRVVREYATERYRLLPYLETLGQIASERGTPVMRPLVLEFQSDHGARTCEDQVMLGPAILVAPVLNEDGRREVYLPPGEWIEYWSGRRVEGGQTVSRELALDEFPVYLRAGTAHPRSPTPPTDPGDRPERLTIRAALQDGAAQGEVYDAGADAIRSVAVETDAAGLVVTAPLSVPPRIEVVAIDEPPSGVTINGDPLEETDRQDGAPGTWSYDAERAEVVAVPGEPRSE